MDFESPDVMKDFPGLYASEISKKGGNNDSDYSDETDKLTKKDLLGKRKDKKDKKDKERGYAALEGESSAEETDAKSPSKIKKTKAFKFSTKSKEKREKSREKDILEKKKDKEKKNDKKSDKIKSEKKDRKFKSTEEYNDISDGMPIFGVSLDIAVERSRCHDGIDLPLPVRACIDYIEMCGLTTEGVYKMSGTKSKVIQLRKLYNQREHVDLSEYDIPTATSLLKMYLRDLPEPIFTSDLVIRFEEAGAILNVGIREKHLRTLTENLPANNRLLLSWLLIHFDNVVLNERQNKMNIQHVVTALSPILHTSNRLLTALLHHCRSLFPTVVLETYLPPLTSTARLPAGLEQLECELKKQESLLAQIHAEMHAGFISKNREELLWEVQRIITQLKRTIKNLQKDKESVDVKPEEEVAPPSPSSPPDQSPEAVIETPPAPVPLPHTTVTTTTTTISTTTATTTTTTTTNGISEDKVDYKQVLKNSDVPYSDDAIALLQLKQNAILKLKHKLLQEIETERNEISALRKQLHSEEKQEATTCHLDPSIDELMNLLQKENHILQIKKINLVRQIMEQEEVCIDLLARIQLLD